MASYDLSVRAVSLSGVEEREQKIKFNNENTHKI